MRKKLFKIIIILTVNFILLSLSSMTKAGTIGNPAATLKQKKAQISFEADFSKRDIDLKDITMEEEFTGTSYMLKGAYGIFDQVNIYAKLGMAASESDHRIMDTGTLHEKFKGDLGLAYGAGINATFFGQDGLKIGAAYTYHICLLSIN